MVGWHGHRRLHQPCDPPGRDRARGRHLIDWDDLDELSQATPLLARVYPNGSADVNHFQAAGGLGLVIRELLDAGLLHGDIACVHGGDLRQQARNRAGRSQPALAPAPATSLRRHRRGARRGRAVRQRRRPAPAGAATWAARSSRSPRWHRALRRSKRRRVVFESQDALLATRSRPRGMKDSPAISWRSCAARARAPTACPNCTS
jgi:hypothetical protein